MLCRSDANVYEYTTLLTPSPNDKGWLPLVASLKLYVSFAEYSLFYRALLQKRRKILRSLLVIATSYRNIKPHSITCCFRWIFTVTGDFQIQHICRGLMWAPRLGTKGADSQEMSYFFVFLRNLPYLVNQSWLVQEKITKFSLPTLTKGKI